MPSSARSAGSRHLPAFPTLRSSDLACSTVSAPASSILPLRRRRSTNTRVLGTIASASTARRPTALPPCCTRNARSSQRCQAEPAPPDRKSTRLNSSHLGISYAVFCSLRWLPSSTRFPYTTLFRSGLQHGVRAGFLDLAVAAQAQHEHARVGHDRLGLDGAQTHGLAALLHAECAQFPAVPGRAGAARSEEHTSELQSLRHLVCRLLLAPLAPVIYPLSLHYALPIWPAARCPRRLPRSCRCGAGAARTRACWARSPRPRRRADPRPCRPAARGMRAVPSGARPSRRRQIGRAHV